MSTSTTASAAAVTSISGSSTGSALGGTRAASIAASSALLPNVNTSAALFREIHKNTWLKRLTADGKKITVGPKKSERSWVVFCVHDDSQALLEGYAEPRQAGSHNPEWIVSMQETQHISHALIPNSHEFEFVVTLHNEVVRFHAMSWEIMQEWVETLRSKLREMKILSPRENLYTKLPEIRAPLLPTRDPTSPLPAPPPVPAALVPGVERVVPQSVLQSHDLTTTTSTGSSTSTVTSNEVATITPSTNTTNFAAAAPSEFNLPPALISQTQLHSSHAPPPALTSMSNTLTQNLLNMLSDPITAYSEQLQEADTILETNLSDTESITDVGFNAFDSNTRIQCDNLNDNSKTNENSVRLDISNYERAYFEQNETLEDLIQCERIPRPQTSRSHSAGAADVVRRQLNSLATTKQNKSVTTKVASNSNNNITELEISSDLNVDPATTSVETSATPIDSTTNITIIQVTNTNDKHVQQAKYFDNSSSTKVTNLGTEADIFKFPDNSETNNKQEDLYKSNVQIIPSSLNSSTIQVVGSPNNVTAVSNQYSTPVKKNRMPTNQGVGDVSSVSTATTSSAAISSPRSHLENHKITTVHVGNQSTATTTASIYGTCYNSLGVSAASASTSTPKLTKKIILSANSSGVTNIRVNNEETCASADEITLKNDALESNVKHNVGNVRYEKVFLSSSIPIAADLETSEEQATTPLIPSRLPMSPKQTAPQHKAETSSIKNDRFFYASSSSASVPSSPSPLAAFSTLSIKNPDSSKQTSSINNRHSAKQSQIVTVQSIKMNISAQCEGSPALQRKRSALATTANATSQTPPVPTRTRFLTRGLTEAVITARPSRKDFCFTKGTTAAGAAKPKLESSSNNKPTSTNNNDEATTSSGGNLLAQQSHENTANCRTRSESLEQRRRSSSTSEAQAHRTRAANNNEFISNRSGSNAAMRMQQPPHLVCSQPSVAAASSAASKRMTLREQQVMQLRREIMHPGGVRLQLRRKDCIGSIAWVDAFGAIWVAGWKQKEHPVLYNALHIGDQLISIAGAAITVAADANKIIRNTNTLFVEVLIRRIPLGRGYAIRREREGQCLGLIRDGNTSTIVDVVPNSLAARHGLPPKAQSCDGSTLTFWVLTEINGRPLNLFFKENEIRDRLNSVGRDISILVQPSDLITKLKKQLKSLRGYKDYLVQ